MNFPGPDSHILNVFVQRFVTCSSSPSCRPASICFICKTDNVSNASFQLLVFDGTYFFAAIPPLFLGTLKGPFLDFFHTLGIRSRTRLFERLQDDFLPLLRRANIEIAQRFEGPRMWEFVTEG